GSGCRARGTRRAGGWRLPFANRWPAAGGYWWRSSPDPVTPRARSLLARAAFGATLGLGALPLWSARQLPMVDLPQHLHLISVLHRLNDPTTLYPQTFVARPD